MKTHKLIIENNKTSINEIEVSIDQILKTTGVEETGKVLNQLGKYVAANVKFGLEIIASFRSLSAKKIIENINKANRKLGSRVRFVMRKIDREIEDLSSGSRANEAFLLLAPANAIVDSFRKEVDSAGGLYNYLQDYGQNVYVGDIASDLFDAYESGISKLSGLKFRSNSSRYNSNDKYDKDSSREKLNFANRRKIKEQIKKEIRDNFGENAENLIEDIYNQKITPNTEKFMDIIENKKGISKVENEKEILDFFNSLKENNANNFSKTLIIEKNAIKEKNNLNYLKAILKISDIIDVEKIYINSMFNDNKVDEESLSEDITEIGEIASYLLIEYVLQVLSNDLIKKKSLSLDKVKTGVRKLLESGFPQEVKNQVNNFLNKILGKLSNSNTSEVAELLLLSMISQDKKLINYSDSKFKRYIINIQKFYNHKDQDFTSLKNSLKLLYSNVTKFDKDNVVIKLKELIESKKNNEN